MRDVKVNYLNVYTQGNYECSEGFLRKFNLGITSTKKLRYFLFKKVNVSGSSNTQIAVVILTAGFL